MVRCMANNYSTFGFWKSWHRSYNLWVVRWLYPPAPISEVAKRVDRYIYIPLGGTRNVLVSSVLIFTFVALWHDLSFKLLAWGWLVSLFLVPELIARTALPRSKASLSSCIAWLYVLILGPSSSSAHSGGIDTCVPSGVYLTSSRCSRRILLDS